MAPEIRPRSTFGAAVLCGAGKARFSLPSFMGNWRKRLEELKRPRETAQPPAAESKPQEAVPGKEPAAPQSP